MFGSVKVSAAVALMFYGVDPIAGVFGAVYFLVMVLFAAISFKTWRLNPEHKKAN